MQTNEAIELWKKLGITRGNMEFSCGGDSMNDYTFEFFDDDDNVIKSDELESHFDSDIYNNVEFYVNSDGHYMGESGNVEIVLNDDEDDFYYMKDAESEWQETYSQEVLFKLTEEQYNFINANVRSINGESSWNKNINYKDDCILSDEDEAMVNELLNAIGDMADVCEIEESNGEPQDETNWTSGDDTLTLTNDENGFGITIEVSRSYYVFTNSED